MIADTQNPVELYNLTQSAINVIRAPGRATVISSASPLPDVDRTTATQAPEFELFHFGFSICSHKVRAILSELGLGYGSNQFAGPTEYENYTPEYVRLRLQSDAAKDATFVSDYSGASSVDGDGFDPLVVPTLVDVRANKVLADSKLICLYLARNYCGAIDLLPADLEGKIVQQMDAVDRTPHVALLYGSDPEGDTRPAEIQSRMPGIHQVKFDAIAKHMTDVADEPDLIAAYTAKLAKEKAAEKFVLNGTDMRNAVTLTESLVADLEETLAASSGPWLFGDRFTLADLVWGISLIRLEYLGNDRFWNGQVGRPNVKAYYERLAQRPSLITAVLDWPGSRKRLQTG